MRRYLPTELDLSRYGRLLSPSQSGHTSPFQLALRNSLIVGIVGTAFALMAAWHISRSHWGEGFLLQKSLISGLMAGGVKG